MVPEERHDEALDDEAPREDAQEGEGAEFTESEADAGPLPAPTELKAPLEALLFASPEPLTYQAMRRALDRDLPVDLLREALGLLQEDSNAPDRGVILVEVAGGWQYLTRDAWAPVVQRVGRVVKEDRLTPAALETLAIVAYKQPVTRAEVDAIRGVASAPLVRALMDRKLVRVTGRASIPGAPFQYGTTRRFLQHFGLRSPKDLPGPKELARILQEQGG